MGWRGLTTGARTHKKKLTLRKIHVFILEKYVEDVKQDEKHVPDLLEAIMKAPGLVKEELRRILFKMGQFRPKITKIKVCSFQISGKITDSANVASETVILTPSQASAAPFTRYLAALAAKYSKKLWF